MAEVLSVGLLGAVWALKPSVLHPGLLAVSSPPR